MDLLDRGREGPRRQPHLDRVARGGVGGRAKNVAGLVERDAVAAGHDEIGAQRLQAPPPLRQPGFAGAQALFHHAPQPLRGSPALERGRPLPEGSLGGTLEAAMETPKMVLPQLQLPCWTEAGQLSSQAIKAFSAPAQHRGQGLGEAAPALSQPLRLGLDPPPGLPIEPAAATLQLLQQVGLSGHDPSAGFGRGPAFGVGHHVGDRAVGGMPEGRDHRHPAWRGKRAAVVSRRP